VYQRHSFADGKRAAAETWARFVEQLVTGAAVDNVFFDESGACIFQELAGVSGIMKSRIAALDLTTGSPICRQRPRQYHNAVGQLNALRGGCRW